MSSFRYPLVQTRLPSCGGWYAPQSESCPCKMLALCNELCIHAHQNESKRMSQPPLNVLILCTGNSARSVLGEALVSHCSSGRARGFSAGSKPGGVVNPVALETLTRHGVPCADARSKSWDEFARPDAPVMDIVITVCDSAANEACPVWPGAPVRVHWGLPDPAHVEPMTARQAAFEAVYQTLQARFDRFFGRLFAEPVETMSPAECQALLNRIAKEIP